MLRSLEEEIERADLIAEALRSHQRLYTIEAEYHAKLRERCDEIERTYAARAELNEKILSAELQKLRKRFAMRGKRMQKLQAQLTAKRKR